MQFPKAQLRSEYFQSSKSWWFNTPDMLYFAYLLLGLLVAIILFVSVLIISFGSSKTDSIPVTVPETVQENRTPIDNAIENQSSPSMPGANSDYKTEFEAAQTQKTYDLRVQAFDRLLLQEQFTPTEKQEIQIAQEKNQTNLERAKKQVQVIENFLDKEYFSDAILRSQKLILEGEVLGNYFEEAGKLLEKAHLKKIDYFLIQKANLTKAEAALKEAQADQISPEKLANYLEQIKALRAAGN